jgi:hypothetical protein
MGLRRIAPEEAQLGMFIRGFEGSWFDHPFWWTHFRLATERDVERIRSSAVPAVLIDDGHESPSSPRENDSLRPPLPKPRLQLVLASTSKPLSFVGEYRRASRLILRLDAALANVAQGVRADASIKLASIIDQISESMRRHRRAFISVAQLRHRDTPDASAAAICALMIQLARELRFDEHLVRRAGFAAASADHQFLSTLYDPGQDSAFLVRVLASARHALDCPESDLDLFAPMLALCHAYDALTSERPGRRSWTPAEALAALRALAGHVDPAVLAAFLRATGRYPVGALVRLRSGRTGMVIGDNAIEPSRPPLVTLAGDQNSQRKPERIDPDSDEIVACETPLALGLTNWDIQRLRLIKRFRS